MAWRSLGEGPPQVLINGYSATSMGWDPEFVAALARSSTLICPDNRGMGGSELGALEEPLTVDSMAADVEALLDLLFPPGVAEEMDEKAGDLVAAARAELSPTALQAQQAALVAWGTTEPPPGTDPPPVLAVCGEEDRVIPPANVERLAARWPNCRVERFAGGGHAFMAQQPKRLADLITSFVGRS